MVRLFEQLLKYSNHAKTIHLADVKLSWFEGILQEIVDFSGKPHGWLTDWEEEKENKSRGLMAKRQKKKKTELSSNAVRRLAMRGGAKRI